MEPDEFGPGLGFWISLGAGLVAGVVALVLGAGLLISGVVWLVVTVGLVLVLS